MYENYEKEGKKPSGTPRLKWEDLAQRYVKFLNL